MSEKKLNELLAIEKGAKGRTESQLKVSYQQSGRADLFVGLSRTYTPFQEDGVDYPPETKNVQLRATEILNDANRILRDLWDITATKDQANCAAKADIVVNGEVLVQSVPATFLLFMEKQLTNVRALVNKLPILDEAVQWQWDDNVSLYRSPPAKVHKTKKVQKPLVLLEPTKEHPGKAEVIVEDVPVGTYETVQLSGCIPVKDQKKILERIETLSRAVKQARERANMTPAPEQQVADKVLNWIFN